MKLLQKSLIATAMSIACAASFAQSSSAGIDPTGEGVVHISGTAVSSCTAPIVNVNLGDIDFHTVKNGATGVYEMPVDIAVTCTNPGQNWRIAPHVASFELGSGLDGQNPQQAFVSFSAPNALPGEDWRDYSDWTPDIAGADLQNFLNRHSGAWGTGTTTFVSKLTFGKELMQAPPDRIVDFVDDFNKVAPQGGVPTGTIDGRGAFSVDIPLQIIY